jgi:hypothetical protein
MGLVLGIFLNDFYSKTQTSMKKMFLFTVTTLLCITLQAQISKSDTIVTLNAGSIPCLITIVDPGMIYYTTLDMQLMQINRDSVSSFIKHPTADNIVFKTIKQDPTIALSDSERLIRAIQPAESKASNPSKSDRLYRNGMLISTIGLGLTTTGNLLLNTNEATELEEAAVGVGEILLLIGTILIDESD